MLVCYDMHRTATTYVLAEISGFDKLYNLTPVYYKNHLTINLRLSATVCFEYTF